MRFNDGKLINGSELGHSPPLYTQPEPVDLSLGSIRKQVFKWKQASDSGLERSVINTESAMEIASWWMNTDTAFSQFSFHGKISEDFKDKITEEIGKVAHESSKQSLQALYAYVDKSMTKDN